MVTGAAPRRGGPAAWLLLGLLGCNAVLGIDPDEYQDAAIDLCACEGVALLFSDCEQRVRDSLEAADASERERWLSDYGSLDCAGCTELALLGCLQSEPVCRARGEPCSNLLDCCGTLEDSACRDGACGACAQQGEPCEASYECCGFWTGVGVAFCHEGTCYRDAPGCKPTLGACTTAADCCSADAGLAECSDGLCRELCAGPTAENCPGCCTRVVEYAVDGTSTVTAVCGDGPDVAQAFALPAATVCEGICYLGVDDACPTGSTCTPSPVAFGVTLDACREPDG